jgi:peptidyl-prolyl cis-trans isomerase D
MLEGLRVASQNWFGRIVMGLVMGFIAISFAVWGIGDVFRGGGGRRLAKVGSSEITVEAFKSAYQTELQRLQQRLRRAITNEEARRGGLDQQVLDRLITDAALDQKTRQLGLSMSEEQTQKSLKAEKVFQGPNGQFDAERFKQIVNNAGFTERSFVTDQKSALLRKALTDAVTVGVEPPRLMTEAFYKFRNEARAIDYFLLPQSAAGEIATPSEDEQKKYFAEREQSFRAKEYRGLIVLAATPTTLAKPADVPEAEVRKLYDDVKGKRYGAPEKREVRQIVFKNEQEALDAKARLAAGKITFDGLIAERKLAANDVNLGVVETRDFGDQRVAASVFALAKPGIAELATTPFGTALSEVRAILPGAYSKSFEQAQAELRLEIAQQQSAPSVKSLRDAIEDQRAAGKTLAEAAKNAGLEIRDIKAVDAEGRDASGKEITGLPDGADLVKAAFASDKGVDNDVLATRDGGYVWFEVTSVEPARQKSFEEVKDAVAAAMRDEAAQKALTAKANDLVEKLRAGKPLDDVAQAEKLEAKRATEVKRAQRPDFSAKTIVAFFDAPLHGAGAVAVDGGQIVFFVKDVATPAFDAASAEAQLINQQLKQALLNDLLEQYVGGLERALNVEINQRALQVATGADADK